VTRSQQRFRLAIGVLGLDAALLAALVWLAANDIAVSGENILFMAVGIALGWGGTVLAYYFGTSESSAQKTELLERRPQGTPADPVHVEDGQ
jgi:uncharacterized RDD family membrane protein YckC